MISDDLCETYRRDRARSREFMHKDIVSMPLKPRIKVKAKGIPIGSYDVIKDNAGKQLVKPKVKRNGATLNQKYASKNRRKWRAAK